MVSSPILAEQDIVITKVDPTSTLVVFDSRVSDIETLAQALLPGAVGFTIDAETDGLAEITQLLAATGAKYLAVVAHGEPGVVHLGKSPLDIQQLQSESQLLQQWGVKEIALYSCEVAQGDIGQDLIYQLSELTAATVAAAETKMGSAALGGSWNLAVTTGQITAPELFQSSILQTYQSVLVSFFPATNYDVIGSGIPVLADINGDSIPDLVTANTTDNSISVLLGNEIGGFGAANTYAVNAPFRPTLADLNGDRIPDLITVNSSRAGDNGSNVAVQLGNGTGGFGAANYYAYAVGNPSPSVALGDINSDGIPDLIVANYGDKNVSILKGNGTGGFGVATNYAVGQAPSSVELGNINGVPEIFTISYAENNNQISVLKGNGAGGFGTPTTYAVGSYPEMTIGDLNGDGISDIVTRASGSTSVLVSIGNSAGGFGAATSYTVGNSPGKPVLADINSDGIIDIITANRSSNDVSVLKGNGTGGFGTVTNYGVGADPLSLTVGNVNGVPQIVTANSNSNNISVLTGNGTGGFGAATNYAVVGSPRSVAIGKVNGINEIVASNYAGYHSVSVLLDTQTVSNQGNSQGNQTISLGQTISGAFTVNSPTIASPTAANFQGYYTDYDLPNLNNFSQISITGLQGSAGLISIQLINAATGVALAEANISAGTSRDDLAINETTYPGIKYKIRVSNQISRSATFDSSRPQTGSYSLSLSSEGVAKSIVDPGIVAFGTGSSGVQVGTINAAGKYFALASSSSNSINELTGGVALSSSGLFYGATSSSGTTTADKLNVIDPSLAVRSQISTGTDIKDTAGNPLYQKLTSLTFGANNQLYALGSTAAGVGELFQIDANTKVATLITTLPTSFGVGRGLVYDAPNNRFLATSYTSNLWQIPLANPTAGATAIGSTGFTAVNSLAFENGQLIGIASSSFTNSKITIDPNTGKGTYKQPAYGSNNGASGIPATLVATTAIPRNDFNGDSRSDILWRNDYGSVALWSMNGATVTAGSLTSVPDINSSWKVTGTGDFNGDGKSDILWRNDNGAIAIWAMDGAIVTSSALTSTPTLDNSWKAAGTGDYNGDGKSDILWRNDNGSIAVWTMNGATVTSSALTSTPSLDNSWKVAGNSDFDGDGKADILWRNDDGSVALWQMNGTAVTASTAISKVSTDWKIAGTGDFNGDGKADILWRNDDGRVALWQMNGAAITSSSLTSTPSRDSSQTIAGIGDYNGDGKADILWRKDSGAVEVWQMNGATVVSSTLTSVAVDGNNWKIAAPII